MTRFLRVVLCRGSLGRPRYAMLFTFGIICVAFLEFRPVGNVRKTSEYRQS